MTAAYFSSYILFFILRIFLKENTSDKTLCIIWQENTLWQITCLYLLLKCLLSTHSTVFNTEERQQITEDKDPMLKIFFKPANWLLFKYPSLKYRKYTNYREVLQKLDQHWTSLFPIWKTTQFLNTQCLPLEHIFYVSR